MGPRSRPIRRETLVAAAVATLLSAALVWLGPPGTDLAAHVYQRSLFLEHGFALWNNFWYAGRYSFITYSILYYPLAAAVGIGLLAVASIAAAAWAFAVLAIREWGAAARWASRAFTVVWPCYVLSGAFPFALGVAFALLALCALQAGRRVSFLCLVVLTVATSPVSFLLLCMVLAAVVLEQRKGDSRFLWLAAAVASIGLAEIVLWRAFPGGGRYPFPATAAAAALAFSLVGFALTWRVERARLLRHLFSIYLAACVVLFLVPSSIGENIARIRFVAVPIAVPRALASILAAAPRRLAGSRTCDLVEPVASGGERRPGSPQPRGERELLAPGDRLPQVTSLSVVPCRGCGHDGALAGRLPGASRHPAHARLVPAERLPREPAALPAGSPRAHGLRRVAAQPRGSVRRRVTSLTGLQRPRRVESDPERQEPASDRVSKPEPRHPRGAVPETDRRRAGRSRGAEHRDVFTAPPAPAFGHVSDRAAVFAVLGAFGRMRVPLARRDGQAPRAAARACHTPFRGEGGDGARNGRRCRDVRLCRLTCARR